MTLRQNQVDAINLSVKNNFKSGIHFHATGSGKSWIALELILKYYEKYPKKNIIWLCEQKSILIEQFDKNTIKEKGYYQIFKNYMIMNYTEKKLKTWTDNVNSATFWNKPILLIINRAFLVSDKKYEKLKLDFSLIIHDECHSIINSTTQEFYSYILKKCLNISCIGFSATPVLDFKPYDNYISKYTIYDAFCDGVIVPPHIKWVKTDKKLDDLDCLDIIKSQIDCLHYKKILVWCGLIDICNRLARLWSNYFTDFKICVDTSKNNEYENDNYNFVSFNEFSKLEQNGILFCACKHREGSDIKNLDCCIFLDKVEDRNPKTFVQCIGRVLRKDSNGKKNFGLIIDLKANSCIKICDRMNSYLNCKNIFPWKYTYKYKKFNKKLLILNHMELINKSSHTEIIKTNKTNYLDDIKIKDIVDKFIIECPNKIVYKKRLTKELNLIKEKKLESYLFRAVEILKMTNYIPHVTRGSCGSSLVCYLLGISNVDPIVNNIKFERFLNDYRNNLPDIDFDFPHFLRDEVFLKLELKWPGQVARISNHVHWHEKSAVREAIRKLGISKKIPKEDIQDYIKSLSKEDQNYIKTYVKEISDTFRHYSLHCGGIVFFHDGIPDDIVLKKEEKTLSQIIYDKNDISKQKNFKIDILSSRGISQLIGICGKKIDFLDCPYDEKTYNMLQSGDNIGVTLAESPLMRKAMLQVKPKSIDDIALCLAIIRPAAKDARYKNNEYNVDDVIDYNNEFVYDDDAIQILSSTLNISFDLADKFRRCLSKGKWEKETKKEFNDLTDGIKSKQKKIMLEKLNNLKKYSFCRSHSYSYAQLVYKLAYQKAHNTKKFWESTLRNVKSSYRKWVHLYEARIAGVDITGFIEKTNDISIYAESRRKNFYKLDKTEQLKKYGYWDMNTTEFFPNCYFYKKDDEYYFGGLIASLRILKHNKKMKIISYICVGKHKYIEIITIGKYYNSKHYAVKGRAKLLNELQQTYEAHIAKYY